MTTLSFPDGERKYETRFTLADLAWVLGILTFVYGGLAIGLAVMAKAVQS
ncbi:MAG: hypothetical protein V3W34_06540 [Phycisphaerae bacterium]